MKVYLPDTVVAGEDEDGVTVVEVFAVVLVVKVEVDVDALVELLVEEDVDDEIDGEFDVLDCGLIVVEELGCGLVIIEELGCDMVVVQELGCDLVDVEELGCDVVVVEELELLAVVDEDNEDIVDVCCFVAWLVVWLVVVDDVFVVDKVVVIGKVVAIVVECVVKTRVGKIGHPRSSNLIEIWLFQDVGITRIHFAFIGHANLFVTAVFSSVLPSKI